tara:strand:+ start:209 stop:493 length:285 start_codon:yes stop_codon:yes gene_type:complete
MKITLKNNHYCEQFSPAEGRSCVVFGFVDTETGEEMAPYLSASYGAELTPDELTAISCLLMAGAGWLDVNAILMGIADQKTGGREASEYAAKKS